MLYDKKEIIKPDGRILRAGGPRDVQRNQRDLVQKLQDRIDDLTTMLAEKHSVSQKNIVTNSDNLFTPEQVDDEINRAVSEALVAENNKYKESINKLTSLLNEKDIEYTKLNTNYENIFVNSENKLVELETQLKILREQLVEKDKLIENLINNTTTSTNVNDEKLAEMIASKLSINVDGIGKIDNSDRPQIGVEFIDPTPDTNNNFESHIEVEQEDIKQENLSLKTERLKSLMNGKLPHRKI